MKKLVICTLLLFSVTACQEKEIPAPIKTEGPDDYIQQSSDIVDMHGDLSNLETFYEFVDHIEQGEKDKIRVVTYTTEGAPLLHDLVFDGETIQSTYDSTRDGFGSGSINKASCTSIASRNTDTGKEYFLNGCAMEDSELTLLTIEE